MGEPEPERDADAELEEEPPVAWAVVLVIRPVPDEDLVEVVLLLEEVAV